MNPNLKQKENYNNNEISLEEDIASLKDNLENSKISFIQTVSDAQRTAVNEINKRKQHLTEYVESNPFKTLSIALAIGFLSGKIIRLRRFL